MGRALVLETTFLIDLEREHLRGTPTGAVQFLERVEGARLYLPSIVAGELAAGVSMANRPRWEAFLAPFFLLPVTPDVAWEYGRVYRHLHGVGQLIGANDLWIAATAIAHRMPVVTRNVDHFRRVPHLEVETY
ncbi:MAG: type II toxin-antitoxin system VapC family toxin [Acidobacteria bacterium]|nr:type II toxin-antitoxin system VapC family toxin [Acidobacteriota bacterium]